MKDGRTDSVTRRPGTRTVLFISYRRRFDHGSARLLYNELKRAFRKSIVFVDVDSIEAGEAFPEKINEALESSVVFLPLISPGWVDLIKELHDRDDFVRREIASALARQIPLIPVLLADARMPKADELPEEIRDLAFRQAIELSEERWDYDVGRLVKLIRARTVLRPPDSFLGTSRRKAVAALAAIAVLLFVGVFGGSLTLRYWGARPDFEACVRANAPEWSGAEAKVRLNAPDSVFVSTEQYAAALKHPNAPEGIPLVLRLSDSESEVGAVTFRFFKADKADDSLFRVEKVLAPTCVDVQSYANSSRPAGDKHTLKNWDKLAVRLGGRDYLVRPDDRGDHITATVTPAAAELELPWKK
jgi:hypothetical protein